MQVKSTSNNEEIIRTCRVVPSSDTCRDCLVYDEHVNSDMLFFAEVELVSAQSVKS